MSYHTRFSYKNSVEFDLLILFCFVKAIQNSVKIL